MSFQNLLFFSLFESFKDIHAGFLQNMKLDGDHRLYKAKNKLEKY